MAPTKHSAVSPAGSASKKRKSISMQTKVEIVKRSEKGETNTEIGRSLGLSRTTIVTIVKDKERIREHYGSVQPMKAMQVCDCFW